VASQTAIGTPTGTRKQIIARHSYLIMQTPTTAQLRTAIEVLNKLGERISTHANHSVQQLPDSKLGSDYAAKIQLEAGERTTQIAVVVMELECWHQEVQQQRRQCVSHHV
jgi:hypothetical protein